MEISFCKVGELQTNCYMVEDGSGVMLVDPGDRPSVILKMIGEKKIDVIAVTHCHHDHIGALAKIAADTGAEIAASSIDAPEIVSRTGGTIRKFDYLLEDGDILKVGNMRFTTMITPGHTKGSMCLYNEDDKVLFSGDTLFKGTHGRTDFKGGNYSEMVNSLKKLALLPDDTGVFPGHEGFSTIGQEKSWIKQIR